MHRSLEGLNQELEEAFVKEQGDEELLRVSGGHKIALNLLGGLGNPFLKSHCPYLFLGHGESLLGLVLVCSRHVTV